MDEAPRSKVVQATERTFTIIDTLRELEGARVSELSEELDMSKGSIHNHLSTLKKHNYVVKHGDQYKLGLRFLDIAEHVRNRDAVFREAKPKVKEIAEETGEVASLMAEDNGRGIFVYRRKGDKSSRPATVGNQEHLHTTAGGKAILAFLPGDRVDEIVDTWGLPKATENTITDREALYEELDTIRETRVSFNDAEDIEGLRAVGTPVMDTNNRVAGSLTVYGPAQRMKGDLFREELPDLLLENANDIQLNVAFNKRQDRS